MDFLFLFYQSKVKQPFDFLSIFNVIKRANQVRPYDTIDYSTDFAVCFYFLSQMLCPLAVPDFICAALQAKLTKGSL